MPLLPVPLVPNNIWHIVVELITSFNIYDNTMTKYYDYLHFTDKEPCDLGQIIYSSETELGFEFRFSDSRAWPISP